MPAIQEVRYSAKHRLLLYQMQTSCATSTRAGQNPILMLHHTLADSGEFALL